jgi:hypothetical protein
MALSIEVDVSFLPASLLSLICVDCKGFASSVVGFLKSKNKGKVVFDVFIKAIIESNSLFTLGKVDLVYKGFEFLRINKDSVFSLFKTAELSNKVVLEVWILELRLKFSQESWPVVSKVVSITLLDRQGPRTSCTNQMGHSNIGFGNI